MANKILWLGVLLLAPFSTESAQPRPPVPGNFMHSQIDSSYDRILDKLDAVIVKLDTVCERYRNDKKK